MKFTLVYKSNNRLTAERYNSESLFNPSDPRDGRLDVSDDKKVILKWCKQIIEWFNETRREGEKRRKFYTVLEGDHALEINCADDPKREILDITINELRKECAEKDLDALETEDNTNL